MAETMCESEYFTSRTENKSKSQHEGISIESTTEEPFQIPPFYNITPRKLPKSPHKIIEEEFSENPWALLVATIFLTKTSAKIARPYMQEFFRMFPTPYNVIEKNPRELDRYFLRLGLKKRGEAIWKMTYQYLSSKWRRASDLYGIGKYGEDAFRIFCMGHLDIEPDDRFLKLYIKWLKMHTKHPEDVAIEDCECGICELCLKYYVM